MLRENEEFFVPNRGFLSENPVILKISYSIVGQKLSKSDPIVWQISVKFALLAHPCVSQSGRTPPPRGFP